MNHRRLVCALPGQVLLLMMAALVLAEATQAQPVRLPSRIYAAEELDEQARGEVSQYVQGHLQTMAGGDVAQVLRARRVLLAPLGISDSQAFRDFYSQTLSENLSAGLEHENWMVRLNAAIIMGNLDGTHGLDLIETALADEHPGVRYWAARTARRALEEAEVPADRQEALRDILSQHLEIETNPMVVDRVMGAIVRLDLPGMDQAVLEIFEARLEDFRTQPGQPLQAPRQAMQRIYREQARMAEPQAERLRELARVSHLYHTLAAEQLEAGQVPPRHLSQYASLIELSQTILRYAHEELGAGQTPPDDIQSALEERDWQAVNNWVAQWRERLIEPPFDFNEEQL